MHLYYVQTHPLLYQDPLLGEGLVKKNSPVFPGRGLAFITIPLTLNGGTIILWADLTSLSICPWEWLSKVQQFVHIGETSSSTYHKVSIKTSSGPRMFILFSTLALQLLKICILCCSWATAMHCVIFSCNENFQRNIFKAGVTAISYPSNGNWLRRLRDGVVGQMKFEILPIWHCTSRINAPSVCFCM